MDPRELNHRRTDTFRPGQRIARPGRRSSSRFHPPTRWIKNALALLQLPTAPFHEQNIMLWVWQFAKHRGLPVRADSAGNLIVDFIPDDPDRRLKRLLFTAHMDHVGFWVSDVSGVGTVRAQWMGRFPETIFPGAKVVFFTGGKALHAIEPGLLGPEREQASRRLKIGGRRVAGVIQRVVSYNRAGDVAEVEVKVDQPVEPGDIGMWDLPEPTHLNGRLSARAIDDVAGVAALVCLMDSLNRAQLRRPVSCLFTRGEEGGFFGATRYCREHFGDDASPDEPRPDLVVSVETSKALPLTPLGSGPIVRVGDRTGVFDPEVAAWGQRCAETLTQTAQGFTFQRRLMDGGTCESSVFQAWTGRAGAICIPLANYHNFNHDTGQLDVEAIDISDWGNLVRLMLAMTEHSESAGGAYGEFRSWCEQWEALHTALYDDPTATAPDPRPADGPMTRDDTPPRVPG